VCGVSGECSDACSAEWEVDGHLAVLGDHDDLVVTAASGRERCDCEEHEGTGALGFFAVVVRWKGEVLVGDSTRADGDTAQVDAVLGLEVREEGLLGVSGQVVTSNVAGKLEVRGAVLVQQVDGAREGVKAAGEQERRTVAVRPGPCWFGGAGSSGERAKAWLLVTGIVSWMERVMCSLVPRLNARSHA
jgi:hypothetical protein